MSQTVLEIEGHVLKVTAPLEIISLLAGMLAEQRFIPEPSKRYGLRIEQRDFPLWDPVFSKFDIWNPEPRETRLVRNSLEVFAGMQGLVETTLREIGELYKINLNSVPALQDQLRLPEVDRRWWPVMQFASSIQRGGNIVHSRSGGVPGDFAIAATKAFPDSRMLFASHYQKDAQELHKCLKKSGIEHGYHLEGWSSVHEKLPRIVVTTFGGIADSNVNGYSLDFAFFLQPSYLYQHMFRDEILRELRKVKLIGLQVDDVVLNSSQRIRQEALFGHQTIRVGKDLMPRRSSVCHFVEFNELKPKKSGNSCFETRQRLYDDHPARNRKLARLAKSIAAGDSKRVEKVSEKLSLAIPDSYEVLVAIVAATADQANLIRQILKQKSSVPAKPNPCVVTFDELSNGSLPAFDVLVRADGIPGPLPECFHDHPPRPASEPLLIIDSNDNFHPVARSDTRRRKAHYRCLGYQVVGGPSISHGDYPRTDSRARELYTPYAESSKYFANRLGNTRSEPEHQYQRRRARQRKAKSRLGGKHDITIKQLADRDFLFDAYREIRREGGLAPGVDGIRPPDVAAHEMGPIVSGAGRNTQQRRVAAQRNSLGKNTQAGHVGIPRTSAVRFTGPDRLQSTASTFDAQV